eukprot:scaffold5245_cov76-Phaeocystis_antarctica.AAC.1
MAPCELGMKEVKAKTGRCRSARRRSTDKEAEAWARRRRCQPQAVTAEETGAAARAVAAGWATAEEGSATVAEGSARAVAASAMAVVVTASAVAGWATAG